MLYFLFVLYFIYYIILLYYIYYIIYLLYFITHLYILMLNKVKDNINKLIYLNLK